MLKWTVSDQIALTTNFQEDQFGPNHGDNFETLRQFIQKSPMSDSTCQTKLKITYQQHQQWYIDDLSVHYNQFCRFLLQN